MKGFTAGVLLVCAAFFVGCAGSGEVAENNASTPGAFQPSSTPQPSPTASPAHPNLQSEILDDRFKKANSPIGDVDFKNYTYPLPHGWQNPDGSDLTLTDGKLAPVGADTDIGMDPDQAAEKKSQRRIGATYVATRYFDVTGDGQDEALVVIKIETLGSAVPQIVYIYTFKDDHPELIWYFRTGDRADGGLKDLRPENGDLVVELYGQDRFLLGGIETSKITDDFEQICCPTNFTRSFYKWNGRTFLLQGKRLTFSAADPKVPPQENLGDIVNNPKSGQRRDR